jgi:hypothetical protein
LPRVNEQKPRSFRAAAQQTTAILTRLRLHC